MAKTAKSAKKPAKKPSKIGNFLSKLNPNTAGKRLLAFVLVFALAGGGYYAYSSFAAHTTLYNAMGVQIKACRSSGASKVKFSIANTSTTTYKIVQIRKSNFSVGVSDLKPKQTKSTSSILVSKDWSYFDTIRVYSTNGNYKNYQGFWLSPKNLSICS